MNINSNELITIYLVSEQKIQSEVNSTIQSLKSSLLTRTISLIDYFRIVTQSNNFVSSLNTNARLYILWEDPSIYNIAYFAQYTHDFYTYMEGEAISCGIVHSTAPAVLYLSPTDEHYEMGYLWLEPTQYATFVDGFYAGCSPFEALLKSTLHCLYEVDCLQLLNDYFPSLNQVYI